MWHSSPAEQESRKGCYLTPPVCNLLSQIAHTVGATVIAVARGAEKAQALKALGADHVIDTSTCGDKPLRSCIKVTDLVFLISQPNQITLAGE